MCRGDPCCLRSMVSGRRSNRCALDNAPLDRAVMSAVSRFASVGRSRSSGRIHLVGDRHAVLAVSVRSDLVGRGVTAEVAHRGNGRALADDPDRPGVCVSATPDAELVVLAAILGGDARRVLVIVGPPRGAGRTAG
jgi:hypothetical protein